MKLPKFAVKNPVTTIMMMCLVLLLGFVSLTGLKLDLMPNMNPPVVAVMTTYSGAGPEEVAEMVTKPIEDIVGTSPGLQRMQSRSSSNSSLVIAQYDWGMDMSEVREDLNSRLGLLQLPDGVERPMIVKFDPTMMPIIQVAVSNGQEIESVQEVVNEVVVPQLQSINGVANVSVSGGFDEEIVVNLDEESLKRYNLTQAEVVQLIQGNNLTFPGGIVEEENEKLNLRVFGKVESINALKQLPVSIVSSGPEIEVITLEDIAEVKLAKKDTTSIARNNGRESLLISIQKEGTANTAEVSKNVKERLEEIQNKHSDLRFTVSSDQGDVIEKAVSNVSLALLFGGIFAVAVILGFLRSVKSTLIVGIAIPFSVISTFVLMYFSGMTLNIMSLGGLALGVGMLVDNAIVVIENIYRHLTKEKTRKEAAIDGATEVSGAVTASMLTTLSVFLPVVFIGGMVGDLFKELALTVTFALLSSWAVALTVVPVLAALLLKPDKVKKTKENQFYKSIINWALDHRMVTLLIATMILVGSLALVPKLDTELMPTQDEGMFSIDVELPEGATFEQTLEVVKEIEMEALRHPDIDVVTVTIGNDDPLMASVLGSGENRATIMVRLVDSEERSRSTERVMSDLESKLGSVKHNPNMTFNLSNSLEAMSGAPNAVEILLLGPDGEQLKAYTEELEKRLNDMSEISTVTNSIETGKPEYQFIVDKEKAFKYGLTTYQVASFVNESLQGKIAGTIFDTEVRVQLQDVSNSKEAIENLMMPTPSGQEVALKELGEVVRGEGPVTIVREDQQDSIIINAKFEGEAFGTVASKVQSEIKSMIDDLDIDTELYTIKMTGGAEIMDESFDSLFLAMILAIVFVYMVMASQFESLVQPFIIMFTLPLAITGVILAFLATGYSFGITAFIGIIILVGIVVNNAIVFIDYTNQLRQRGLPVREALVEAGLTRLRPIIMTALTTMLGLLPLAIGAGEGAEIQAPMAIAVIGGLFSSTLLTLVVIPVIYSLVESLKGFRKKWKLAMEKFNEAEQEMTDGPIEK
ncbi:HAE1 family hydrophobic/amphiphilic exporter-1 [Caldalkalibacillus uzonensis]|uniref:HAE1 family hydrophobic/amphiphilic exporter-1 n=1 Tax=Caldalkalibacillus uzonensis TaxID=353224 RepID=A0ABU0CYD5_9BACI|nr:efflux RND transporter permease subunit [Caldalkalibacillus uzonensis]MDQ0341163.1 HAE1 family hydrophobic/amphiphilic exporter-1 [Caldalkalibacillus uzonensis]